MTGRASHESPRDDVDDEPLVKRALKEELLKPRYRDAFGAVLNGVLLEQGLAARLCNRLSEQEAAHDLRQPERSVASTHRTSSSTLPPPEDPDEELTVVKALREQWNTHLQSTLAHHCEETMQPVMRLTAEGSKIKTVRGCKWLFTIDDFLELLRGCHHPNMVRGRGSARSWCLTPVQLRTPTLSELQDKFAELAPTVRQSGLDDELRGWFADDRCTRACKCVRACVRARA